MDRKTLIINADNFSDLEGFYCEIDNILTKNLGWKTGHNLDAFNDLLRGGFGVHEYEEPIKIIWKYFEKSKIDLGRNATIKYNEERISKVHPSNVQDVNSWLSELRKGEGETLCDVILDIINGHEHIELELK